MAGQFRHIQSLVSYMAKEMKTMQELWEDLLLALDIKLANYSTVGLFVCLFNCLCVCVCVCYVCLCCVCVFTCFCVCLCFNCMYVHVECLHVFLQSCYPFALHSTYSKSGNFHVVSMHLQTLPEGQSVSDEFLVLLACGRARCAALSNYLVNCCCCCLF